MNHSTTKIEIGEVWLRHLLEKLPAGATPVIHPEDREGCVNAYFFSRLDRRTR